MEEQLAGPCTAEVAAFDRFADFLDPTAPAAPPAVLAGLFAAGGVSTPGTESVTNTG